MWNTENVPNSNLLQPSFFQHFTTQLLLTFYNPTASNPLQRGWFDLLKPNFIQPFTTYLLLVFYNPRVSNLLQPTCFQPFTIQLFLTFYNPAASNCYKILSKFWNTENVPNSKLWQPSFFQSFNNPAASNLLQPTCF